MNPTLEMSRPKVPVLAVYDGHDCAIGRANDNDIVLPGRDVSRYHAAIECDGLQMWVRDMGSRNGTSLNGERLVGYGELHCGDELRLGSGVVFRIQLMGMAPVDI